MIEHPHDDIEAFALGALDDISARRVLAHADECPTCAVLLAEAMHVAASLETPGERPLAREIRLSSLVGSTDGRSRRPASGSAVRRLQAWLVPLAATAAALIVIWAFDAARGPRPAGLNVPVAALVHSHFTHHALHGPKGDAKVIQALDGRWLYLVADGLAPNSGYRLFEIVAGTEREVGAVITTPTGQATGYWEQSPTRIDGFALRPQSTAASAAELRWP